MGEKFARGAGVKNTGSMGTSSGVRMSPAGFMGRNPPQKPETHANNY